METDVPFDTGDADDSELSVSAERLSQHSELSSLMDEQSADSEDTDDDERDSRSTGSAVEESSVNEDSGECFGRYSSLCGFDESDESDESAAEEMESANESELLDRDQKSATSTEFCTVFFRTGERQTNRAQKRNQRCAAKGPSTVAEDFYRSQVIQQLQRPPNETASHINSSSTSNRRRF